MQSNLREAIALGLGFRNELLRIYLVTSYCNDLLTLLLSLSLSSLYFYVVIKTRGHPTLLHYYTYQPIDSVCRLAYPPLFFATFQISQYIAATLITPRNSTLSGFSLKLKSIVRER